MSRGAGSFLRSGYDNVTFAHVQSVSLLFAELLLKGVDFMLFSQMVRITILKSANSAFISMNILYNDRGNR